MTPMKQAVNDWLNAQHAVMQLSLIAHKNLRAESDKWMPRHHDQWARAVQRRQRECRRCGLTLVALYPAANDEDGRGPMSA